MYLNYLVPFFLSSILIPKKEKRESKAEAPGVSRRDERIPLEGRSAIRANKEDKGNHKPRRASEDPRRYRDDQKTKEKS
jgi:hypothetical protein